MDGLLGQAQLTGLLGVRQPTLLDLARQKYPRLPSNLAYKESFGRGEGLLEYWPQGEPGSDDRPRPGEIPMGMAGVEVFDPRTRPEDVAADIVSHEMINSDPFVAKTYRNFLMSMDLLQQKLLQDQYAYAQKNYGESRPFNRWAEMTGQPAFLRGYAFGQWPKEFNERVFRPEQRSLLDGMVEYLKGQ